MLIGSESNGIGLTASIIEPSVNREASDYIINNYSELINVIKRSDIRDEKAQDLLHDVYISIVEAENDGNGFDMEYGSKLTDDCDNSDVNLMDVSQFVIGRIKLYAKNTKYRTDIIEAGNSFVHETQVYYETELDKHGQEVLDKNGKPKLLKRVERKKVQVTMTANAATFNDGGDVTENNDDFQKAFATASVADSTDDITEILSLREQIDYCIEVCELHDVNILNIFKNMDKLADMLGDYSKKKKTAESVFSKLTELAEYHSDFGQTLMDIFKYSSQNRAAFDIIIASY